MQVDLKQPQAVITIKPPSSSEHSDQGADTPNVDKSYKMNMSANGFSKADQAQEAKEELPPHIQRLKDRIEQIKVQIEEQQQKVQQMMQDGSADAETIEAAHKQLAALQMELGATMTALGDALREAKITDPGILLSAIA